jgi:hypothetical protein
MSESFRWSDFERLFMNVMGKEIHGKSLNT